MFASIYCLHGSKVTVSIFPTIIHLWFWRCGSQPHSADHSLYPGGMGERIESVKVRKLGKTNALYARNSFTIFHGHAGVQPFPG